MTDNKVRNIGIIAHVDAGKTTVTERILYFTGASHRYGEVHHGDTITDSSVQEREKGITIDSAAVTVEWNGHRITIIDTPGHIDFNMEVNRSLRVLDGAIVVFDAVAGVEPQSETNWRLADRYAVPRLCLVNKMDRVGADFLRTIQSIKDRLDTHPLVLQLPIGAENQYQGLVDLITMRAYLWYEDKEDFEIQAIPNDILESATYFREVLLTELADLDDDLMEQILAGTEVSEQLYHVIRKGTLDGHFVPVCCASAFKNKGIQPLLDAVIRYLPSPEDRPSITALTYGDETETQIVCRSDQPFSALAFKVTSDKHGTLTYLRVYSGQLNTGEKVQNSTRGHYERMGRMYVMQATKRQSVQQIVAGDIVAVLGLKQTDTGDTLCAISCAVVLERIVIPAPVIEMALEAKTKQEQNKLSEAIRTLASEDPSLHISTGKSGETLLSGMGELHLEVVVSRLQTDFDVIVNVGKPQVAYRETISKSAKTTYLHKKQRGGPGQFAEVTISVEPIAGEDIEFESRIVGTSIPKEYIPSVEAGIRKASLHGVLGGYPCDGFKAVLHDGNFHAQDSSPLAFEIAAMEAFKKVITLAKPRLLEPLMALEIITPQQHVGDCIGDLNRRRGVIKAQSYRGNCVVINAAAPLSMLFGYIGDLRSLTSGRANFLMALDRYEVVPAAVAQRVLTR